MSEKNSGFAQADAPEMDAETYEMIQPIVSDGADRRRGAFAETFRDWNSSRRTFATAKATGF